MYKKVLYPFLCLTALFLVGLCGFKVQAAEYEQQFCGKWFDYDSDPMRTEFSNDAVRCIDQEKGIYEISYSGDANPTLNYISGSLPSANCDVKITDLAGNAIKATKRPNWNYDTIEEPLYWFNFSGLTMDARTIDGGNAFCLEITENDVSIGKYTFIVNIPKTISESYLPNTPWRFSKDIDLVNTKNDNNIVETIARKKDWTSEDSVNVYQTIELSDDITNVALRFGQDTEYAEKRNVPETYQNSVDYEWLYASEKMIRVNGGNWMYCSETTEDHEKVSPDLQLEPGWNLVEIAQVNSDASVYIKDGGFNDSLQTKSAKMLLLIYSKNGTQGNINSSTDIYEMAAYAGVKEQDDPFTPYETTVDNEEGTYTISMPSSRKYQQVMVRVDLEDMGATWKFVDENGEDVGVGYIGREWGAFNSEGLGSIFIEVTASDGTIDRKEVQFVDTGDQGIADLQSVEITGARLKSGESFAKDTTMYTICLKEEDASVTFKPVCEDKRSTVTVDGQALSESGEVTVQSGDLTNVKVTAPDGYTTKTYRFLYEYPDGSYPYFGISDSTREMADSMLEGYKKYVAGLGDTKDLTSDSDNDKYWMVYRMLATGLSIDDSYVYDMTKHEYKQATDYASAVIVLSMIGENPYDFNGRNFVKELEDSQTRNGAFGAYANNIWAYMAFKVAGYDYPYMDELTNLVKQQANRRTSGMSWSLDMSAWAMAVMKDEFTPEEKADWAEWLKESCLHTDGDEAGIFEDVYYRKPNSNTHGTILTALNALNIDPERHYTVSEDKSPLKTMQSQYLLEDGMFKYNNGSEYLNSYNKDAIIGLGDLVMGSNVWNRAMIEQSDLTELLTKAKSLLGTGTDAQNKALQQAYDVASKVSDVTKNGEAYYNLLEAAKILDASLAPQNVRMCSVEQGKKIDALIADINALNTNITLADKNAVEALKDRYDALENDVQRSYVTNYEKLKNAVHRIQSLQDEGSSTTQQPSQMPTTSNQPAASGNQTTTVKAESLNVKYKAKTRSIKLKWNKINGSDGYKVFIYNTKAKKYKKIADVKASKNVYTVKRLKGTRGDRLKRASVYKFKVVSYVKQNGKKKVTFSEKITASTKLANVRLQKISSIKGGKARLTWSRAKNITGYEIWMKNAQTGNYRLVKRIKDSAVTRYTLSGLSSNTTYSFKIRVYKKAGKTRVYGTFSNLKNVRIG